MTTPNHIAGGVFFAGFFGSLWNLNIFSQPKYLIAVIIASLISDIDNPKSLTGKIFFFISIPLSKVIRHRTLTHSLIVYLAIYGIVYSQDKSIALFVFTALVSHSILDMLTLGGVTFFYPLSATICVIPANRAYRFLTGDLRPEIVIFLIFITLNLSAYDIIKKGFWVSIKNIKSTENIPDKITSFSFSNYSQKDLNKLLQKFKGDSINLNIYATKPFFVFNKKKLIYMGAFFSENEKHFLTNDLIIKPLNVKKKQTEQKKEKLVSMSDLKAVKKAINELIIEYENSKNMFERKHIKSIIKKNEIEYQSMERAFQKERKESSKVIQLKLLFTGSINKVEDI